MTKFLAGVLSVIAAGVVVIAYALMNPRASAFEPRDDLDRFARPTRSTGDVRLPDHSYLRRSGEDDRYGPTEGRGPAASVYGEGEVRSVQTGQPPRRQSTRVLERERKRGWKKDALVVGGSTAVGAGLGGAFGGKKGALIGAALGGGASTIYQTVRP